MKRHSIHQAIFVRYIVAGSLGLVNVGLATTAVAQQVGEGTRGRAVRITRDTAASRTVAKVYEGLYSFVRIERSEPGAAPNLHPVIVSVSVLKKALGDVQLGTDPLFNETELAEIVPPLTAALGRTTADQDISFAVSGKHSALAMLAPRSVTSARLFRNADGLQLIVGLAQRPFESEFNATGVLIAFEPGRRNAPVDASIRLSDADPASASRRADWVSLPIAPVIAEPALTGAPTTAQPPPSSAPPSTAPRPAPKADASHRDIAERLKILQSLRDTGLITQQEYEDKRRQILNDL